jgi:predicted PurR-regulated permease PerM
MAGTLQNPQAPRRYIRVDISPRIIAWVVGLAVGGWLLLKLWEIVVIAVVALMLAGTFAPAVGWMERHGIRRHWGVLLLLLGLLVGLGLFGLLTVPPLVRQVSSLVSQAPRYREQAVGWLEQHRFLAPLAHSLQSSGDSGWVAKAAGYVLKYSEEAALLVGYAVTTLVLALYLLADKGRVRGALFALVPRNYHLRVSRILINLEIIVGGYIRGQAITSVLMAIFTFALLSILRVPNALALAVFAGITDVLPFIGGLLATTPAALGALTRGVPAALVVVAAMVLYQEFESRVIVPRVYGRVLRLPAIVVLMALLVGGTLGGILGALLALPIAAGIRMAARELRVELPGETVAAPELRERDERAEQAYERRTEGAPAKEAAAVAVKMAEDIRHEDAEEGSEPAEVPVTGGYSSDGHAGDGR